MTDVSTASIHQTLNAGELGDRPTLTPDHPIRRIGRCGSIALAAATALCGLSQAALAAPPTPTVQQLFIPPWSGNTSPDGLFRISGPWVGTGDNEMEPSLAQLVPSNTGQPHGYLKLSVAADKLEGSEIQSLHGTSGTGTAGYGYGYYETAMRVTSVPGVVDSFFWIEAPSYGPHEWDVEFTTNESWINSANSGLVHLTLHPSNTTFVLPLAFNPSRAFHRYGFLWTPGTITFTVDGEAAHSFSESDLNTPAQGFIMANTWTGNANFGGGPPTHTATSCYAWMKFTAGLTTIPRG